jgi:2-amino-4-hydroxy-6-hydroxymethyldihydropteridine diphosphokinase
MSTVFLILGSNLGNRSLLLEEAKNKLIVMVGSIIRQSSVYETEPWGFNHHNLFLNQVVIVKTELEPLSLLNEIKNIEKDMGRIKGKERYAARVIDIDILFYDYMVLSIPQLTIPHLEIPNRRFVLEPLAELDAYFIHPGLASTIKELLEKCLDNGIVKKRCQ